MEMTARSRVQNNKGAERRGVTWRIEKGRKGDSCGQHNSVADLWAQQSGVLCLTHPLFEGSPQCPEPPLGSTLRYGHKAWPPPLIKIKVLLIKDQEQPCSKHKALNFSSA